MDANPPKFKAKTSFLLADNILALLNEKIDVRLKSENKLLMLKTSMFKAEIWMKDNIRNWHNKNCPTSARNSY